MKPLCLIMLLAPFGLLACVESPPMDARIDSNAKDQQLIDSWYVSSHLQGEVTAAVISQRALFPYHFEPGTARLTELGQRDLAILSDYYKTTPGALAVVRGEISDELYAARVAAVKDVLQRNGIELAKLTVGEGVPGGTGISGQEIVEARKRDTGQFSGTSTDTGSMTSEGTTSGETKGSSK